MSIANLLAQSTKKDQNIFCDSLTAESFNVDTITVNTLNADTINADDINATSDIIALGNVTGNEVFASLQGTVGSIGNILVAQGSNAWSTGVGPGVTPLNITGLDGDVEVGYRIEFAFVGQPTNSNNFLFMRLNDDNSGIYASRSTLNQSPGYNNNANTQWNFIDVDSANNRSGCGSYMLWVQAVTFSEHYMTGTMVSHRPGAGNEIQTWKMGFAMDSGADVTSINIDINNTNHTGWTLHFRIYRLG